jgi:shikimate kinase
VALARLRRERAAWYEEVSKVRVDASSTLEEVARAVIDETKALTS